MLYIGDLQWSHVSLRGNSAAYPLCRKSVTLALPQALNQNIAYGGYDYNAYEIKGKRAYINVKRMLSGLPFSISQLGRHSAPQRYPRSYTLHYTGIN